MRVPWIRKGSAVRLYTKRMYFTFIDRFEDEVDGSMVRGADVKSGWSTSSSCSNH